MTANCYNGDGLPYLPIERVGEYPECLDGRPVLLMFKNLTPIVGVWFEDLDGDARNTGWLDDERRFITPTHFFPASIAPIGEYVAVEYAVLHSRGGRRFSVSGNSDYGVSEWIGDSKNVVQTGVVRIQIRHTVTDHQ